MVNTGRPELINEVALVSALRSGHVKAAALDIQHIVDVNCATQLAATGQIIHTARTSWLSEESAHELRVAAAKELRRALTGRIPQDLNCCVNKNQLAASKTSSSDSTFGNHVAPSSSSSSSNQPFNSIPGLGGFLNAANDGNHSYSRSFSQNMKMLTAYNMQMPTSFGTLQYPNPLLMNPQLLMGNPALGSFPFAGTNPASLAFGNAASRLLSQSPKSNNKRNRSGASTPANNPTSASANRTPSISPSVPPSHQNGDEVSDTVLWYPLIL